MNLADEARAFFEGPYNCAQAVLGPFAERFGLPLEAAFRIATPFGGGMGHAGSICGAVSGALMVIGLAEGTADGDRMQRYACYALAAAFQARFRAQHGDLTCPALLGLDIGDPAQLAAARKQDLFHTRCPDFVGDAVRITVELLGVEDDEG
jgi:C_GCAxxG_C_C family probable redox protein